GARVLLRPSRDGSSGDVEDRGPLVAVHEGYLRPLAGGRQAAQLPVVDQEGVLGLPATCDARVPGDGVTGLDPLPVPRAVALARGDLELALAVGDRAALVVLTPCAGPADLGVGVVAGAQHVPIGRADTAGPEHA